MAYQIIWTEEADQSLYQLTRFLADNWSEIIVRQYIDQVYDVIDLLGTFPEMGRISDEDQNVLYRFHSPIYPIALPDKGRHYSPSLLD